MSNDTSTLDNSSSSEAALLAEIAKLKAENLHIKAEKAKAVAKKEGIKSLSITDKGGISLYNLGRFPVTLYPEQWVKVLDKADEIRKFMGDNKGLLEQLKEINKK